MEVQRKRAEFSEKLQLCSGKKKKRHSNYLAIENKETRNNNGKGIQRETRIPGLEREAAPEDNNGSEIVRDAERSRCKTMMGSEKVSWLRYFLPRVGSSCFLRAIMRELLGCLQDRRHVFSLQTMKRPGRGRSHVSFVQELGSDATVCDGFYA